MITRDQYDAIAELVKAGSIEGAVAVPRDDGSTRVIAWGGLAVAKTVGDVLSGLTEDEWAAARIVDLDKPPADAAPACEIEVPRHGTRPGSRTDRALALLEQHPQMRPAEAAARLGISPAAVYRAAARRQRPCCTACGRPIN